MHFASLLLTFLPLLLLLHHRIEAGNIKRINSNGSSESSDSRTSSSSGRFAPAMSFDKMTIAIPGDGSQSPIGGAKTRTGLKQAHNQHVNPSTSSPSEKLDPLTAKLRQYRREMEESEEEELKAQQIKGQTQSILEEEETTNSMLDKNVLEETDDSEKLDPLTAKLRQYRREMEESEEEELKAQQSKGQTQSILAEEETTNSMLDKNILEETDDSEKLHPLTAKLRQYRREMEESEAEEFKTQKIKGQTQSILEKEEGTNSMLDKNILEETDDGRKFYENEGKMIPLDKQSNSSSSSINSGLEASSKGKGRTELALSLLASDGGKKDGSATASSSHLAQSLLSVESKNRLTTEKGTTTSKLAKSLLDNPEGKAPSQARVSRPQSFLANSKAAPLQKRSGMAQSVLSTAATGDNRSSASTTAKKPSSFLLAQSLLTEGGSKSRPTAESLLSGESHSVSLLSSGMAKLVSPPDVKLMEKTQAGCIKYTLKNGDILEVAPDGRLAYAPEGRLNRNGAPLELIRPDLAKILREYANLRPLPSIVEINETNGIQYKMMDGKILKVTADGTICYENEEGNLVKITKRQKEQQQPPVHSLLSSGKKEQPEWWWQPPYGEVKKGQETRSGGLQFNMKDGTLWEAKRDGRIFWRNANGEVIEMNRDGTPKKINKPLPPSESSTHSKGAVQSILALGHRQAPANVNVSLINHPAQSLLSDQHTNEDGTMVQGSAAGSSFRTTGLVLPHGKNQHGLVLNNPNTIVRFEHSLIENKDDDDNYEGNRHHRNIQHYYDDFEEHGSADRFF